jgi:AraC family L-rhamnose operon regulatory protein RhaS
MKRLLQHEPLLIQQLDTDHWSFPVHTQNYFELILIQAGSGNHSVNGNKFVYQAGDIFFLRPSDSHSFVIHQKTCFYSLSFTELYIANLMKTGSHSWVYVDEPGSPTSQPLVSSLATNRTEHRNLLALVDIILTEQHSLCPLFSNPIVESVMSAILSLLDRRLAQLSVESMDRQMTPSSLVQRIVAYVCRHITEPNELRMDKIADVFNYSPSHLGALFKEQIGESIQQYIIRYKLKLVEARLGLSTMTISQIADEFGFTDVCHLNKLFKRYYHHTPSTYRRGLTT